MSSSARESEFPTTSIGRSSGARLQQAAFAHEAHPLLSPTGPVSPADPSQFGGGVTVQSGNGLPKYVPYTPRQRPVPTAVTTGTTVHPPPSPQHHHGGDATSKLQLMHLKAAAQNIGLDGGTLGWCMLEKVVHENDTTEEWAEIWSVLTANKATLLLPLEAAFANEKITADFVKDHIVLCEGPSRKNAPIVTLSGLRGTLYDDTLTFRSILHPTSKSFQNLLNPQTRTSALTLLPRLPIPLPDLSPAGYPSFTVPSYSSLQLPPKPQLPFKPPLPPRPGARPAAAPVAPSRLPNPFASLFGGNPKSAPAPVSSSPTASLHSVESTVDSASPIEVSAFTINRRIIHKQLAKDINKTLKGELKAALAATSSLGNVPVPGWVAERVQDITADWFPFTKSSSSPLRKRLGTDKGGKDGNGNNWVVNPWEETPDDAAERLQDFYLCLEQDMRVGGTPFVSRRKERDHNSDAEDEKETEKREHDKLQGEVRVRDVMEAVERTITCLFYDRLFMQPTSDDASHDEALSSRVAALNMLDLTLTHLGIEVPKSIGVGELDAVVKACGDMLTQLEACQSPGDKAAILVAAHKIVVDGLSRLPPIRLISEDEKAAESEEEVPHTARPLILSSDSDVTNSAFPMDVPPSIVSEPHQPLDRQFPPTSEPDRSTTVSKSGTTPPIRKEPPPPLSLKNSVPGVSSSVLEVNAPPKEPTPVSGDVLLPLIIFSVVKANPPHLVSHLLFTQRFRNQSVGGEESYCLINLMAVAEFLENVDMAALGLGDSDKVMSAADLTPIPLTRSPVTSDTPLTPADNGPGLRGRVEQGVDAIADSANKVISGVVDSSFGILRSFMPNTPGGAGNRSRPVTPKSESGPRPGGPGFGLLRKESGFSIASLAASLPIPARARPGGNNGEETGQQLITVSRPGSVKSSSLRIKVGGDDSQDESDGDETGTTGDEESEGEGDGRNSEDEDDGFVSGTGDARSIRSFESMLKDGKGKQRPRKSLTDRLASVAGLKTSPTNSRRSSLLQPLPHNPGPASPTSSRPVSPVQQLRLAPPKRRFLECTPDDLRLSEVGELLREYRRLAEGIRAVGGFDD